MRPVLNKCDTEGFVSEAFKLICQGILSDHRKDHARRESDSPRMAGIIVISIPCCGQANK